MLYSKEQVIESELRHAKNTADRYNKAERAYKDKRGLVPAKEEHKLLEAVMLEARVMAEHIWNLNNIDFTVKMYNNEIL